MNEFVRCKGESDGTPDEHESVSLPKEQAENDHVYKNPPPKRKK